MEKITKREMYEALVSLGTNGNLVYTDNNGEDVVVTAESLVAFAEKEIAQLDKKSAKAKERAATKRAEGDELTELVRQAMSTEEFETTADIASRIEGEDVTIAKISYRLTQLVKNQEAEKKEVTIPGKDGQKARKVQAYRLLNE